MENHPSAGPTPDHWPFAGSGSGVAPVLGIAERECGIGPLVDAQGWGRDRVEKRFIGGHLAGGRAECRVIPSGQGVEHRDILPDVAAGNPSFCLSVRVWDVYLDPPMAKQALGKGLSALINTRVVNPAPAEELGERVQNLDINRIVPSPLQPRVEFRGEQLQELVESIRERGIIQPLIVRKVDGKFELIAGERRWRAAGELGLKEAPAIVREASDREVLELALIENLQREDLNPIEEATAYERLSRDFGLTQEDISKRVGKSRASVANAMRLLDLAADVQGLLKHGRISVGHAKVLLSLKSHDEQKLLAEQIVRSGASVRVAEKLAAQHLAKMGQAGGRAPRGGGAPKTSAPAIQRIQNLLTHRLSTRVVISHGEKKGSIQIEYYGDDDLNRLLGVLGVRED